MKSIVLNIGGKDRTFYFGLGFLGNLLEKENIGFQDIDTKIKENPFKWIPLIMFYSLAFGFTRKNENPDFDAFDVSEWVDEIGADNSIVNDFFIAFRQSLVKDVPESKTDSKKKITIK